jgi:hypothetical protein
MFLTIPYLSRIWIFCLILFSFGVRDPTFHGKVDHDPAPHQSGANLQPPFCIPSVAHFELLQLQLLNFDFDANPDLDPAFHSNRDRNLDPAS